MGSIYDAVQGLCSTRSQTKRAEIRTPAHERQAISALQRPTSPDQVSHLTVERDGDASWCSLGEDEAEVPGSRDQGVFVRRLGLVFQVAWNKNFNCF